MGWLGPGAFWKREDSGWVWVDRTLESPECSGPPAREMGCVQWGSLPAKPGGALQGPRESSWVPGQVLGLARAHLIPDGRGCAWGAPWERRWSLREFYGPCS